MKKTTPACPYCETNKYVVRDRSMEKAGTLPGGGIGAGSACADVGNNPYYHNNYKGGYLRHNKLLKTNDGYDTPRSKGRAEHPS